MSTVIEPHVDPYQFGWRDTYRPRPDGTLELVQVPLTLKDVLHPEEGDVIPVNSAHDADCRYLADALGHRYAPDPSVLVLHDCQIRWNHTELSHHTPDVSVIFGLRRRRPVYPSFHVIREGVRPRVLFEVVSPESRVNDVETKVDHYYRVHIPVYIIVDREHGEGPIRLLGYRHTPEGYLPLPLDENGRLWIEPLRLWLATEENRVVLFDEQGQRLGNYNEVAEALAAAEDHTEQATAHAEQAKARAEQERIRADQETGRAEAEAKARAEAEERIRQLEAALQHRQGEPRNGPASPPPG